MAETRNFFREYPERIKASTLRSDQMYDRMQSYFAIQGMLDLITGFHTIWESPDDQIAVFRSPPPMLDDPADTAKLRPVYQLEPAGPPLVPTGLIFVRYKEGVSVEDMRQQIAGAGFEVFSIPPYAPHSAWLSSADGRVSSALAGIARLEALCDMVNVEPQMLGPSAQR